VNLIYVLINITGSLFPSLEAHYTPLEHFFTRFIYNTVRCYTWTDSSDSSSNNLSLKERRAVEPILSLVHDFNLYCCWIVWL